MTTAVERRTAAGVDSWWVGGQALIDDRPATAADLWIGADGTWRAEVATFTLANQVEVYFESTRGGHFYGPAFVERSRADSDPLTMRTALIGVGPLLVVAPDQVAELPADEVIDVQEVE